MLHAHNSPKFSWNCVVRLHENDNFICLSECRYNPGNNSRSLSLEPCQCFPIVFSPSDLKSHFSGAGGGQKTTCNYSKTIVSYTDWREPQQKTQNLNNMDYTFQRRGSPTPTFVKLTFSWITPQMDISYTDIVNNMSAGSTLFFDTQIPTILSMCQNLK